MEWGVGWRSKGERERSYRGKLSISIGTAILREILIHLTITEFNEK